MEEQIKFFKTKSVKTPSRGTEDSAGIDFYIPNESKILNIKAQRSILIPTGIKAQVPKGYTLVAFNKSGIAVHKHLQVGACVVDSDYQGEIFVHLYNVGGYEVTLFPGEKFIQFLLLPVPKINLQEVLTEEELFPYLSERGDGCMGSTNNK